MKRKRRAFVTDGSYPNALAVVRALGEAGYEVSVAEREAVGGAECIAFWSRHCVTRVRYPDPRIDAHRTARVLAAHFRENAYDVAIPVGLEMTGVFVHHRELLDVPTMLPPLESFLIAADKRRTYEHAAAIGVRVPLTRPAAQWREFETPFVFKHFATGALVMHSQDEAARHALRLKDRIDEYVAQEYVPGENGFGYFGFFQNGDESGYFMHERLMQIPREGGPSVVAAAIRDPQLHQAGRKLLESLRWHGAAMVEFKRSERDGELYLMETNPKLWGSLDLAIASGANFPLWIAQSATGEVPAASGTYRDGVKYQWVLPNGLKCFARYPEFRASFVQNLLSPKVRSDLSWRDPMPCAAAVVAMASHLVKR